MRMLALVLLLVASTASADTWHGNDLHIFPGGTRPCKHLSDCSGVTRLGVCCVDIDDGTVCWGNGSSCVVTGSGGGDITDVWGCTTGNCSTLTAASGDSIDCANATSCEPCKSLADCSTVVGLGQCCVDTDDGSVCFGNSSTCVAVGAGSGDITDVWNTTSGNVNALTAASGDSLSCASGDTCNPCKQVADCVAVIGLGACCVDTDNGALCVGNGTTCVGVGSGSGDITDVMTCTTGNCSAVTAAAGDTMDMSAADSSRPCKHLSDCSVVTTLGRCCVDTDTGVTCYGDGDECNSAGAASALGPVFHASSYGAKGDGSTDDSVALQAMLDAADTANGVATLSPGKTYIVSIQGSKTLTTGFQSARQGEQNYALLIGSGTTLDCNGATIKHANATGTNLTSLLMNKLADEVDGQDTDISVYDCRFDGNRTNTPAAPGDGVTGAFFFHDVAHLHMDRIVVDEVEEFCAHLMKVVDSDFGNMECLGSDNAGWNIGDNFGSDLLACVRCTFEHLSAEDILSVSTPPGNPGIVIAKQSQFGDLFSRNCESGWKFGARLQDITIDSVVTIGDGNEFEGFKVQGFTDLPCGPISVGQIIAMGIGGPGFYADSCDDISIDSYIGRGNGAIGSTCDFNVTGGASDTIERLRVGSIFSTNAAGGTASVRIANNVNDYAIGNIHVTDPLVPVTAVNILSQDNYGTIDSIEANDFQGTPIMTGVLVVNGTSEGTSARGRTNTIKTNLAPSTSLIRWRISGHNHEYQIGPVYMPDAPIEGDVTLTNTSTTTAVAAPNVMRVVEGGTSTWTQPIIQITPINASAMALEASGGFRTTATSHTAGTGFTITHATAGATDRVHWRLLGYANSDVEHQ